MVLGEKTWVKLFFGSSLVYPLFSWLYLTLEGMLSSPAGHNVALKIWNPEHPLAALCFLCMSSFLSSCMFSTGALFLQSTSNLLQLYFYLHIYLFNNCFLVGWEQHVGARTSAFLFTSVFLAFCSVPWHGRFLIFIEWMNDSEFVSHFCWFPSTFLKSRLKTLCLFLCFSIAFFALLIAFIV